MLRWQASVLATYHSLIYILVQFTNNTTNFILKLFNSPRFIFIDKFSFDVTPKRRSPEEFDHTTWEASSDHHNVKEVHNHFLVESDLRLYWRVRIVASGTEPVSSNSVISRRTGDTLGASFQSTIFRRLRTVST